MELSWAHCEQQQTFHPEKALLALLLFDDIRIGMSRNFKEKLLTIVWESVTTGSTDSCESPTFPVLGLTQVSQIMLGLSCIGSHPSEPDYAGFGLMITSMQPLRVGWDPKRTGRQQLCHHYACM